MRDNGERRGGSMIGEGGGDVVGMGRGVTAVVVVTGMWGFQERGEPEGVNVVVVVVVLDKGVARNEGGDVLVGVNCVLGGDIGWGMRM